MSATLNMFLAEPLPPDAAGIINRLRTSDDVHHLAIMPDVHVAEEVCVGTVLATKDLIYPAAVGGDIGCGIATMRLNLDPAILRNRTHAARILSGLYDRLPAIRKHRAEAHDNGSGEQLSEPQLAALYKREGKLQLGTLGRGNHFLEFQRELHGETGNQGVLWVMVHSGSRAMGPAIRNFHAARGIPTRSGLKALSVTTDEGRAYLHDMQWARNYAAASRRAMLAAVATLLHQLFSTPAQSLHILDCDHNHVQSQHHDGQTLWVHRKGANAAGPGTPGLIPGSMATPSFHTLGTGEPKSLHSSSHGAGRTMSRQTAKLNTTVKDVLRQMENIWFDHRAAPRLREEIPTAYKDIRTVMRAQNELVKIVRVVKPILSFKG